MIRSNLLILEQKVDDLKPIIHKLDAIIEKLSEVNTTVTEILLSMKKDYQSQEEIDSVLFAKIDELRDKMDSDHHSVLSRIQDLEKKVWVGIGCVVAVSIIIQTGWIDLTPKPVTGTIVSSYSE